MFSNAFQWRFLDEESFERKASRKEREGRARKGAKTTEGQGKHYGTSQLEQHPYSRGKRESLKIRVGSFSIIAKKSLHRGSNPGPSHY